jgi:Fur family iron response transcriptional regulator
MKRARNLVYTGANSGSGARFMSRLDILDLFDKNGIMPTPQRLEVAAILLGRPQHMSADQIIDELRQRGSRVSKATVYNTLNLFGERGIVREVMVDPVRKFYDSTTHPHHHFYNEDTGELSDIPDDAIAFSGLPELPEGTEQAGVDVLIRVREAGKG